MNVNPLKQSRRTNCGQTAVAMLTGKSIKEVEAVYGHGHATYATEHMRAVERLGCVPDYRGFKKFKVEPKLPEIALVRMEFLKRTRGGYSTSGKTKRSGHLVLWANGYFFDPGGMIYTLDTMPKGMVIDQHLEVLVP